MAPEQTQLFTVQGVELFAAGKANGETYTAADIDALAANGRKYAPYIHPTVGIGHELPQPLAEGLPATSKMNGGEPQFGSVDAKTLRREDVPFEGQRVPTLIGDLIDVPDRLAELIRNKNYTRVSAELYSKPPSGVPAGSGPVLRRIVVLGTELPAVKSLAALPMPVAQNRERSAALRLSEVRRTDGGVLAFCEVRPAPRFRSFADAVADAEDLRRRGAESRRLLEAYETLSRIGMALDAPELGIDAVPTDDLIAFTNEAARCFGLQSERQKVADWANAHAADLAKFGTDPDAFVAAFDRLAASDRNLTAVGFLGGLEDQIEGIDPVLQAGDITPGPHPPILVANSEAAKVRRFAEQHAADFKKVGTTVEAYVEAFERLVRDDPKLTAERWCK